MAGLTFVLEPRCSRSEPLVHSLCGDGPRLTLTPQGRSWGTESPPRSSGSYTGWSHGQTLSCPATKQIKNLLPELLVCGLKKESIIVLQSAFCHVLHHCGYLHVFWLTSFSLALYFSCRLLSSILRTTISSSLAESSCKPCRPLSCVFISSCCMSWNFISKARIWCTCKERF